MTRMRLSKDKVLLTVVRLQRRIGERFPNAGLLNVAGEMVTLTQEAHDDLDTIGRPAYGMRILSTLSIGAIVLGAIGAVVLTLQLDTRTTHIGIMDLIQVSEALVNDLILLGAAIWFFAMLERRKKRARVSAAVNKFRSLAHLIDVHQLQKNPEVIGEEDRATESSPVRDMSPFEMGRYFDYCSELLSLVGKIAALYGDQFEDPVVLEMVNDLESLTIGLQRKIWQKIMVMESRAARMGLKLEPPTAAAPA